MNDAHRLRVIGRRLLLCDVFTSTALLGNGLAVVFDADDLALSDMQAIAAWTNQAETAFLISPTDPSADYRVRIFTPQRELAFAGHPTLGSCAAWLYSGARPRDPAVVRQECGIGTVEIDISGPVPAFVAPPTRIAALPAGQVSEIVAALGIDPADVRRAALLDNGSVWPVLELSSAAPVLAVAAERVRGAGVASIGLLGVHPEGAECHFEIRMLSPTATRNEDPVTGSLNAAVAVWLQAQDRLRDPIIVSQGTCIERTGRIHLSADRARAGQILVGGHTQIISDVTLNL